MIGIQTLELRRGLSYLLQAARWTNWGTESTNSRHFSKSSFVENVFSICYSLNMARWSQNLSLTNYENISWKWLVILECEKNSLSPLGWSFLKWSLKKLLLYIKVDENTTKSKKLVKILLIPNFCSIEVPVFVKLNLVK